MRFCFRNSVLMVMSCHNRTVNGSVFTKFPNSTLGVMSWRSSTSATPLRRKYHHEVPNFRCYGECLHKVPLLQLHSWGNVISKFRFRSSQSERNIFMKFCFCNSAQGVMSWRSSTYTTLPRRDIFTKFRNSAVMVLSSQSFASANPLRGFYSSDYM